MQPKQAELKQELARQVVEAVWSDLRSQLGRDALILVAPELDLLTVGLKIAGDETGPVTGWIDTGLLAKPSAEQLGAWESQPEKPFAMLILQPYILIQEQRQ